MSKKKVPKPFVRGGKAWMYDCQMWPIPVVLRGAYRDGYHWLGIGGRHPRQAHVPPGRRYINKPFATKDECIKAICQEAAERIQGHLGTIERVQEDIAFLRKHIREVRRLGKPKKPRKKG